MRKHPGSCYPIADTAKLLKQWRVDLQLSGHTGGQFMIPGVGAVAFTNAPPQHAQIGTALGAIHAKDCAKVVRHWEWAQGFHQVGTNQLYINRGLGTYHQDAILSARVTVITLVAKSV